MAILGVLEAKVKADTKDFDKDLKKSLVVAKLFGDGVAKHVARAQKTVSLMSARMGDLTTKFFAVGAATTAVTAIISRSFLRIESSFTQYRQTLETMEGTMDAANKKWEEMFTFAEKTPFSIAQVMESYKTLRAFGLKPTVEMMTTLGDTAAALGGSDVLGRIALVLGQIQAQGFMTAQDMNQLANAGINAGKVMKDTFGLARDQVAKTRQAGITAQQVIDALLKDMGKFSGQMERMNRTIAGQWEELISVWERFQYAVMQSGVADYIAALLTTINKELGKLKADGSLEEFAETVGIKLKNLFKDFVLGMAKTYDTAIKYFDIAKEKVTGTWSAIYDDSGIPDWVWKYGIIGGLLVGRKGAVAVAAYTALLDQAAKLGQDIGGALPQVSPETMGKLGAAWQKLKDKWRGEAGSEYQRNVAKNLVKPAALDIVGKDKEGPEENKISLYEKLLDIFDKVDKEAGKAKETVKNLNKELVAPVPEVKEMAEKQISAIEKVITALERQRDTFGMTAHEIQLYDLALQGAALADIKAAEAIIGQIESLEKTKAKQEEIKELSDSMGDAFASAFGRAITEGESLREVLKGLVDDLTRLAMQKLVMEPISGAVSGFAGQAVSAILGGLAGGFGGGSGPAHIGAGGTTAFGMANGGWINEPVMGVGVNSGMSYAFGEGGESELVTPKSKLGGGAQNTIIMNISTPDVSSFRASQSQLMARANQGLQYGQRNL